MNVAECCENEPEIDKVKEDIDDVDSDGGDGGCCIDDETDDYDHSEYNCVRDFIVDSDDSRFKSNPKCSCIES